MTEAFRVYLAGPVTHTDEAGDWRRRVEDETPWECLNPLERCDEGWSAAELIDQCFTDIHLSDGVFVGDTGHRSPGTWREVQYAHGQGIPIVIWDIDSCCEDFIEVYPVRDTCSEAIATLQRILEAESHD